jgi:hypothetical protein
MKYTISQVRESDTKAVDVTKYFPTATEPVTIRVKRLTNEKRNEVLGLTMMGQHFSEGNIEIKDISWIQKARIVELLHGVDSKAEDFPFESWTAKTIQEIDERCPEFIEMLADAIREINSPLASKSGEKSET